MNDDESQPSPAEASRLLAELRDPDFRRNLDALSAIALATCNRIQAMNFAVLEVPRAEFDALVREVGPDLLACVDHCARVHEVLTGALQRTHKAVVSRRDLPKPL